MRILFWLSAEDSGRVSAPFEAIAECHTEHEFRTQIERHRHIDLVIAGATALEGLIQDPAIRSRLDSIPIVIRCRVRSSAISSRAEIARWRRSGKISVESFDQLDDEIHDHLTDRNGLPPDLVLLESARSCVPHQLVDIVVATVLIGRRRTSLAALALVCGVAPRTVEWRLHHLAYPTARHLLGWSLALHTLWRIDSLGWPLKKAAIAAGFADANALSDYVQACDRDVYCRKGLWRASPQLEATTKKRKRTRDRRCACSAKQYQLWITV
jgi:hypothetical protein